MAMPHPCCSHRLHRLRQHRYAVAQPRVVLTRLEPGHHQFADQGADRNELAILFMGLRECDPGICLTWRHGNELPTANARQTYPSRKAQKMLDIRCTGAALSRSVPLTGEYSGRVASYSAPELNCVVAQPFVNRSAKNSGSRRTVETPEPFPKQEPRNYSELKAFRAKPAIER